MLTVESEIVRVFHIAKCRYRHPRVAQMWRNVTTLLSGNALSQLLNVVTIAVVVTRYISPADFGRYAVLMSYVGIISVVACLRFEVGIVSTRSELAARNLTFVALITAVAATVLFTLAAMLIVLIWGDRFFFGVPIALLALVVLAKAIGQVLAGVLYRRESYGLYSISKLVQALVMLCGFFWVGVNGGAVYGLTVAMLASYLTFAVLAGICVLRTDMWSGVRRSRMIMIASRERDFVKFNSPQALVDTVLANGVSIVLLTFSGATAAGYYSFMQRTIRAPLGLVFGAISQVVFRFASKHIEAADRVQRELIRVSVFTVFLVSAAAACVWIVYACFDWFTFLSNWRGLREYMPAFAAWLIVPFFFSPFAMLPVVYGRQRRFFVLATSFNFASLAALAILLAQGLLQGAFFAVALISIVYFGLMSVWALRLTHSER